MLVIWVILDRIVVMSGRIPMSLDRTLAILVCWYRVFDCVVSCESAMDSCEFDNDVCDLDVVGQDVRDVGVC